MIGTLIATQARTYLGTPFHHQGRSRYGLDCIGLVVRVLDDLGVTLKGKPVTAYDRADYAREPTAPFLHEPLERLFMPVTQMEVGDIVLFRIGTAPRHVGIVTEVSGVSRFVHAYEPYGKVREDDDVGERWRKRFIAAYRLPEGSIA
jgi:cell wall-associated NlpC family hydrolase